MKCSIRLVSWQVTLTAQKVKGARTGYGNIKASFACIFPVFPFPVPSCKWCEKLKKLQVICEMQLLLSHFFLPTSDDIEYIHMNMQIQVWQCSFFETHKIRLINVSESFKAIFFFVFFAYGQINKLLRFMFQKTVLMAKGAIVQQ